MRMVIEYTLCSGRSPVYDNFLQSHPLAVNVPTSKRSDGSCKRVMSV